MAKRKDQDRLELFVGIDLHKKRWHVTIMTRDAELFSGSIPGAWEALREILDRYKEHRIRAVYEASYFGFWLYDRLVEHGIEAMGAPPSLVPREYGNRVETDRRDSRKLAHLLVKGLLKRVWVPSEEERCHRQGPAPNRPYLQRRQKEQYAPPQPHHFHHYFHRSYKPR